MPYSFKWFVFGFGVDERRGGAHLYVSGGRRLCHFANLILSSHLNFKEEKYTLTFGLMRTLVYSKLCHPVSPFHLLFVGFID